MILASSSESFTDYEVFHLHLLFPPSNRERPLSFEAIMQNREATCSFHLECFSMFSHCRKIHSESFISAKALRLQVQVGWSERSINPFRVALKRTPKEQDRLVRPRIRLMMDSVRITAFPLIPADHSANSILQSVRSHKSHPKIHRFSLGSVVPFFLSVDTQMVAR
jgi:hypothetical protein